MKQKIVVGILCVVLLIFIVFCININKNNITTIKFSSWGSQSETEIIKSAIKQFENENPDIKVDFIHIPQNYFQKIHLLFASGLEPDVIFINNQNIKLYISANLLENLEPYFENEKNDFFNEALNCFKQDNKIYAIPRDISNLVIYYNKDIAKNSGIKFPKKFNDIYELRDIANKLTTKEHWGINFEENPLYWTYYLASNGGGILSDDAKSVILNTKESYDALNLYSDMINKQHIVPTKAQVGSMTSAQMFINGKIAMYLSGRWMVPKFRDAITFDWDIIEFPATEKNKVYIDSSGWAISKKSKNKEAAIKFIKYISSKNTIDELTKSGLIVPARIDSAASMVNDDTNKKPNNDIAFIDMIKYAKPTPVNVKYSSINDLLQENSQDIFISGKKAEDVFNQEFILKIQKLL